MTSAEDQVAAALRASKAINQGQQNLTEESRLLLAALLREEMSVAVAEGIQAVMTNEVFWARVFEVLQKQATDRTGRFLVGGLKTAASNLLKVGLLALLLYGVGGWTLVKAVWTAMTKG